MSEDSILHFNPWIDFNDGPPAENPFGCEPDPDQVAIFLDTVFSWCEGLIPLRGFVDKGHPHLPSFPRRPRHPLALAQLLPRRNRLPRHRRDQDQHRGPRQAAGSARPAWQAADLALRLSQSRAQPCD